MLAELFSFEIRYHLKQVVFYVSVVIFFFLTFGAVTSDSVQIGGSIGLAESRVRATGCWFVRSAPGCGSTVLHCSGQMVPAAASTGLGWAR